MENIKAFFGISNSDDAAKQRCREYLVEACKYGKTLDPVPTFITQVEEFLAETTKPDPAHPDAAVSSNSAAIDDDSEHFWSQWDEHKEDALNLLTGKPENHGVHPDGQFVAMWQYLEHGRLPASTAPPEAHQTRRRSSLARVRLA